HRWKVEIEVKAQTLVKGGQLDGMVIDFGDLKKAVKNMVDDYDHALIIEKTTMSVETLHCLVQDGFKIIQTDFRPTAENFAAFFFQKMKAKGFNVKSATVYETPSNSASFEESEEN
ncbi:MAG: 6-carboxytetrahydropterin synthase, partial [Proteocatella sp.]